MMDKKLFSAYILMAVTAALITVTGIIFRQSFIRLLPLYFSLVIMLLNSGINRYGSLIGGLNSLLYAYTYFYYKLYAMAVYALVVSFPLQIVTFILWTKQKDGRTTRLRRMTGRQRTAALLCAVIVWIAGLCILRVAGGNHSVLDNSITILGIIITLMTMFAYVEYTYLALVNGVANILLNVSLVAESPEMITYLIFSVYSFICNIRSVLRANQIYNEQRRAQ